MDVDWGIYKTRLLTRGVTTRDRVVSDQIDALERQMRNSPSFYEVMVGDAQHSMLIRSTDFHSEKEFQLLPGDKINIGDIVVWSNMHWLVTKIDFDDEITRKGRIVQCNRQIRWQNPRTLEIIERWCLVTKPYTSNVSNGITISSSEREFKVQLPFDEETRLIDLGKRFMLEVIDGNPRTYECTSTDQNTNKYQDIDGGFIVINLTQDPSGHVNDRVDLLLCDYIDPGFSPSPPPPEKLKCAISGKPEIKIGMKPRNYQAIFYAADGETVAEGVRARWTVDFDESLIGVVAFQTDGNSIQISVPDDESLIGKNIMLTLIDSEGSYYPVTMSLEVTAVL